MSERDSGNCAILLSGGWDSAYCLVAALKKYERSKVRCYFYDYGQPYYSEEAEAVKHITEDLNVRLEYVRIQKIQMNVRGVFDRRNLWLIAHLLWRTNPEVVFFGCRNPLPMLDRYGDSNWRWARAVSRLFGVPIRTPCMLKPKFLVRRGVIRAGVPEDHVFSTEGLDLSTYQKEGC